MLPKNSRIARKDYPSILIKGRRFNSPILTLNMAKIEGFSEATPSKVSFSVSKKVARKAVLRNKLRRRGY